MELGHFPWVAIVCWLFVLPSWFWDRPFYQLTAKANIRVKLRDLSIKAQERILRAQGWLGEPYKLPRVRPTLLATLFVLVIASYTGYGSAYAMDHKGNLHGERFHPLLMTRLYANWGMFAPNPPSTSGWFVTVAKQKDGDEVDVWTKGQPATFDMPRVPSATYKRQRWRKFGDNILSSGHAPIRGYFLRWLCKDWNENHQDGEVIEQITLYHMAQTVNWPGQGYGPLSKNQLAKENCPAPEGQEAKKENKQPAAQAKPRQGKPRSGPPRKQGPRAQSPAHGSVPKAPNRNTAAQRSPAQGSPRPAFPRRPATTSTPTNMRPGGPPAAPRSQPGPSVEAPTPPSLPSAR
jgi:hypothetical protein